MIKYFLIFIVFGIVGWIINSSYRSITQKKFISGTVLSSFFTYGFGGLGVIFIYQFLDINIFLQIILATFLVIFVELISGIFSLKIMKKRYWDYSKNKFNFMGHIDVLHSFYWLILMIILRIIFPYLPI
jgi:uncharacterized membrane protein